MILIENETNKEYELLLHSPKANPQQMDYILIYSLEDGEIKQILDYELIKLFKVKIKDDDR